MTQPPPTRRDALACLGAAGIGAWIAGALGCSRTAASPSLTTPEPGRYVFTAHSAAHLAAPLQEAFAKACAEATSKPAQFDLVLKPGHYKAGDLALEAPKKAAARLRLSITTEGGGVAVLTQTTLRLKAASVRLEGLVLSEATSASWALGAQITERFEAKRVSVVRCTRAESSSPDPLIRIVGTRASNKRAEVRWTDSWWADNTVQGDAPLLGLDGTGRHRLARCTLERVALLGNRAKALIAPGFTAALELIDCGAHTEAAALRLNSPLTRATIQGGAWASTAALLDRRTSPDVALGDFPPIDARDATLRSPSATPEPGLKLAASARWQPKPNAADWSWAHEQALSGATPTLDALSKTLRGE